MLSKLMTENNQNYLQHTSKCSLDEWVEGNYGVVKGTDVQVEVENVDVVENVVPVGQEFKEMSGVFGTVAANGSLVYEKFSFQTFLLLPHQDTIWKLHEAKMKENK